MKYEELIEAIDDAECELDEVNESGTLEDRMKVALKINKLKNMLNDGKWCD